MGFRRFFANLIRSAALGLLCLGLSALPGRAETLEELERIAAKARDLDSFLADPKLVDEYYEALARYVGPERMPRSSFDAILAQLRELKESVPEVKERLWKPRALGKSFEIEVLGRSDGVEFDVEAWQALRQERRSQLEELARPIREAKGENAQRKQVEAILARARKRIDDFHRRVADGQLTDKQLKAERGRFFGGLRKDPRLRSALAYLAGRLLEKAPLDGIGPQDALLALHELERTRDSVPQPLPGLEVPSEFRGMLADLLPDANDLVTGRVLKGEGLGGGPGNASIRLKPQRISLKALPRSFHGIFKGVPFKECVGGNCEALTMLRPERWVTAAIRGNEIHVVERDGKFNGFTHEVPFRMGREVYATVEPVSSEFNTRVLVRDPGSQRLVVRDFFDVWLKEAESRMPRSWRGHVVGKSGTLRNTSGSTAPSRSLSYVFGKDLGDWRAATLPDPIEGRVVEATPFHPEAARYLNGRLIHEASVEGSGTLVLLDASARDDGRLEDPVWLERFLRRATPEEKARVFSYFQSRRPSDKAVLALLTNEASRLRTAIHGQGGLLPGSRDQQFFLDANPQAVLALHLLLESHPASRSERLEQFRDLATWIRHNPFPSSNGTFDYLESRVLRFLADQPTFDETAQALEILPDALSTSLTQLLDYGLQKAKTPDEVRRLIAPFGKWAQNGAFKRDLDQVLKARFAGIAGTTPPPTLEDWLAIRAPFAGVPEFHAKALEEGMRLAQSKEDYLRLLAEPGTYEARPGSELEENLVDRSVRDEFFQRTYGRYLDPLPSIAEIHRLARKARITANSKAALLRTFLPKSSATEFVDYFQYAGAEADEPYRLAINFVLTEKMEDFLSLRPSEKQILRLRSSAVLTESTRLHLTRSAIAASGRMETILELLSPPKSASEEYFQELRDLAREVQARLPELKATAAERGRLLGLYPHLKEPESAGDCLRRTERNLMSGAEPGWDEPG